MDVQSSTHIPRLGLGTWQNVDLDQCARAVQIALEAGYRHVDTAQVYGTEGFVGQGVAAADVDREDVFLATKLWFDGLAPDAVRAGVRASLARLGTEYVDLLYVHWPAGSYDPEETLGAFAGLHDEGTIRHVGVSNFTPSLLDEAIDACPVPIVANQVELHPLLPQEDLREHCIDRSVTPVAYSPLAHGEVFDVPALREVAEKHDANVAQVSLAWLHELGVTAIPKATSAAHVRDNRASLDLELDDEDLAVIDGIEAEKRLSDASFAPDW